MVHTSREVYIREMQGGVSHHTITLGRHILFFFFFFFFFCRGGGGGGGGGEWGGGKGTLELLMPVITIFFI